jgi:hypothetical protein
MYTLRVRTGVATTHKDWNEAIAGRDSQEGTETTRRTRQMDAVEERAWLLGVVMSVAIFIEISRRQAAAAGAGGTVGFAAAGTGSCGGAGC